MRRCFPALCLALPLLASAAPTPEQADIVSRTEALRADPLGDGYVEELTTLLSWWTTQEGVTLDVCAEVLAIDGDAATDEIRGMLYAHGMLGVGVARLTHPEMPRLALHRAGIEAQLTAYAALKAARPDLAVAPLDKLAKRKLDGSLPLWLGRQVQRCK